MTATVTHLSGLHGHGLQAFRKACRIVDANLAPRFDPRAESLLRSVRDLLTYARDVAHIDEETAHSFVARAGNKLQLSIHMADHGRQS